jgi:hypothetical protein
VFRRRSAGATDGTAQDSPGAQSPDTPAETKTRPAAESAKGRPTPKRSVAEAGRRQPITRALARDFIDSKRRISEYYMYVLVVLLAAVFVRSKSAQAIISPLVLALVLVIVVDGLLIRRSLRRLMAERLPGESARGLTMYAVMRALQIRRFRVPSPRVKPGDKF